MGSVNVRYAQTVAIERREGEESKDPRAVFQPPPHVLEEFLRKCHAKDLTDDEVRDECQKAVDVATAPLAART